MMVAFMASLGLPGLVAFAAEYGVFVGVYAAFGYWVFIPILTVVFTAAYYIFSIQRALFGPLNPKWEKYPDMKGFEVGPLSVLCVAFAVFGILPILIYQLITPWATRILTTLI
jgi:NADH-quinone oxidoreductase subunit M